MAKSKPPIAKGDLVMAPRVVSAAATVESVGRHFSGTHDSALVRFVDDDVQIQCDVLRLEPADVVSMIGAIGDGLNAGEPKSMRFYVDGRGDHAHVRIFSGPKGGTRGLAGGITLRRDEWALLRAVLTAGAALMPDRFQVEFYVEGE